MKQANPYQRVDYARSAAMGRIVTYGETNQYIHEAGQREQERQKKLEENVKRAKLVPPGKQLYLTMLRLWQLKQEVKYESKGAMRFLKGVTVREVYYPIAFSRKRMCVVVWDEQAKKAWTVDEFVKLKIMSVN